MKKGLIFVYGVFCYLLFVGALVGLIGFLGHLPLGSMIDSGEPAPLLEALLVNGSLILLFGLQHSVMAGHGGSHRRPAADRLRPAPQRDGPPGFQTLVDADRAAVAGTQYLRPRLVIRTVPADVAVAFLAADGTETGRAGKARLGARGLIVMVLVLRWGQRSTLVI